MSLMLLGALGASGCSGCISPVPPIVTPELCPTLKTCNSCVTNLACGWCGTECIAATAPSSREAPPSACKAPWSWAIAGSPGAGTCPTEGRAPPVPTGPPPRPGARNATANDAL